MSNQVVWTKATIENFIEYGNLDEEEAYIIRTRGRKSRVEQSMKLNRSVSWVDKRIRILKSKYDTTQKQYPELFKPRAKSSKYLY